MYFLAQANDFISIIETDSLIPVMAIALGCTVAVIAIIAGTASKVAIAKAREKSRRELAAYVAEGTMAPDDAVALMNAGKTGCNITVTDSLKA
ncbi:MAG: hypothetical protein IH984_10230 [Planctomycetes bacterium]|nr:hypothetical protein [Planctomycetota bacterium]